MYRQTMTGIVVVALLAFCAVSFNAQVTQPSLPAASLTQAQASHFAQLALKCIPREFPNKPDHVLNDVQDVQSPKAQHPAFYGCFDWHSSVHGHWMLVRLLRSFPDLPEAGDIRKALNATLGAENILVETAYLKQKNRQSFERTYGWAWLLKLAEELSLTSDNDAKTWSRNLRPLVDALVDSYIRFLPKQTYPIRTGVHPTLLLAWLSLLTTPGQAVTKNLPGLLLNVAERILQTTETIPAPGSRVAKIFFHRRCWKLT